MGKYRAEGAYILRFVIWTGLLTAGAVLVAVASGGLKDGGIPSFLLMIFFGAFIALAALAVTIPVALLITLPVWLGVTAGLGALGMRRIYSRLVAALVSTGIWAIGLFQIRIRLPGQQPRSGSDPIPVEGMPEAILNLIASFGYLAIPAGFLVCLRLARFHGE
jgi:hypothetical protein